MIHRQDYLWARIIGLHNLHMHWHMVLDRHRLRHWDSVNRHRLGWGRRSHGCAIPHNSELAVSGPYVHNASRSPLHSKMWDMAILAQIVQILNIGAKRTVDTILTSQRALATS